MSAPLPAIVPAARKATAAVSSPHRIHVWWVEARKTCLLFIVIDRNHPYACLRWYFCMALVIQGRCKCFVFRCCKNEFVSPYVKCGVFSIMAGMVGRILLQAFGCPMWNTSVHTRECNLLNHLRHNNKLLCSLGMFWIWFSWLQACHASFSKHENVHAFLVNGTVFKYNLNLLVHDGWQMH